jgi:hypothetical protein
MALDKVLHDRTRPRKKEDGRPEWSFKAPCYDNRTSCSIPAGNDYDTGFKQPVGKMKASGMESGPIPQKSVSFSPDKIFGHPTGKILKDGSEDQKG